MHDLTTSEVKAWLNRGRGVLREVETMKAAKYAAEVRASGMTVGMHEKIARSQQLRGDELLVKLSDYSAELDARIAELYSILAEIAQAIYSVEEGMLRLLLINRYILFKRWEQIAVDMNYRYQHVHRLHGKALEAIAEWFDKNDRLQDHNKKDVIECDTISVL